MERETGCYWVKFHENWVISYYDGANWHPFDFKTSPESNFSEINENRILSPDEQTLVPYKKDITCTIVRAGYVSPFKDAHPVTFEPLDTE